jgi:hypothetical protein
MASMKLKIQREYTGLCGSCRHATLAETRNGKLLIRCDWFSRPIDEPIAVCSKHSDRRLPSLSDMRNTAWILQTDDRKRAIGFISNQQWRKSKNFRDDLIWQDDE